MFTLCPTNLYARICGLKFQTIRQESMDTEAERNQVLNLFYIRHVYISILSMFSKCLFFFNNVINSLLNEDL